MPRLKLPELDDCCGCVKRFKQRDVAPWKCRTAKFVFLIVMTGLSVIPLYYGYFGAVGSVADVSDGQGRTFRVVYGFIGVFSSGGH
jgi:hypothetical protein